MKKNILLTLCLLMATTTAFSQSGNVLTLDGSGDFVDIGSSDAFALGRNFTIETWVKFDGTQAGYRGIVTKGADDWRVQMNSGGTKLEFSSTGIGDYGLITRTSIFSEETLTVDSWIHLATVCNDTLISIYMNGEKTDSLKVAHLDDLSRNDNVYLGSVYSLVARVMRGQLDEVRIWNVVRTTQEIQDNMNTVLAGTEQGLAGYWNFDDGTFDDLTSNANNGTAAGDASITSFVSVEDGNLPASPQLQSNYPNPFVGSTTISYALTQPAFVNVTVYDMLGREVKVLANEFVGANQYELKFDGKGLPSGVYIYKLVIGDEIVETKSMVLAQ